MQSQKIFSFAFISTLLIILISCDNSPSSSSNKNNIVNTVPVNTELSSLESTTTQVKEEYRNPDIPYLKTEQYPHMTFYTLPSNDTQSIDITLHVGESDVLNKKGYVLISSNALANIENTSSILASHVSPNQIDVNTSRSSLSSEIDNSERVRVDMIVDVEGIEQRIKQFHVQEDSQIYNKIQPATTGDIQTVFNSYTPRSTSVSSSQWTTRKVKKNTTDSSGKIINSENITALLYGKKESEINGKKIRIAAWVCEGNTVEWKKDGFKNAFSNTIKGLLEDLLVGDTNANLESLYKKWYALQKTHYWDEVDVGNTIAGLVDSDNILNIVFQDLSHMSLNDSSLGGFVYSLYPLTTGQLDRHNITVMEDSPSPTVYINYDNFLPNSGDYSEATFDDKYGTYLIILHEIQHLATFYKKNYKQVGKDLEGYTSIPTWFNELISVSTETMLASHVKKLLEESEGSQFTDTMLKSEGRQLSTTIQFLLRGDTLFNHDSGLPLGGYRIARAFGLYLAHNYGVEVMEALMKDAQVGTQVLFEVIKNTKAFSQYDNSLRPQSFNDMFHDFTLGMFTSYVPYAQDDTTSAYKFFIVDGQPSNKNTSEYHYDSIVTSKLTPYNHASFNYDIVSYNFTNNVVFTEGTYVKYPDSPYSWMGGLGNGVALQYPDSLTDRSPLKSTTAYIYLGGVIHPPDTTLGLPANTNFSENKDPQVFLKKDNELLLRLILDKDTRHTLVEISYE